MTEDQLRESTKLFRKLTEYNELIDYVESKVDTTDYGFVLTNTIGIKWCEDLIPSDKFTSNILRMLKEERAAVQLKFNRL